MTQTPTDALRMDEAQRTAIEHAAMDANADVWRHCRLAMVADGEIVGYPCFSRADMAELARLYEGAPASPLLGGGPHERWSILNHLGELWTPENFDTERQATSFLDSWKRDNPKMDLSKHKVIPVLVTMTAAPTGDA